MQAAGVGAVKPGVDAAVLRLTVFRPQAPHRGEHQAAVPLDGLHHGAQGVHVGHQQQGAALAAQAHPHAALAGLFRGVAQAGELLQQVVRRPVRKARGAVDGAQRLQLFDAICGIHGIILPNRVKIVGHRHVVVVGGKRLLPGHTVALGHPDRGQVVRLDDGADLLRPQHPKGVVPAGPGGLAGVALVPEALFQQVAHLQHRLALAVLPGEPRLAHHLPCGAQHHRPQAKAVLAVALLLAGQPVFHVLLGEGVRVGIHDLRVQQHLLQVGDIPLCHLPQQKPPGA